MGVSKKRPKLSSPKIVVRFSSFSHPQSILLDSIKSHPFNRAVEVVFPSFKTPNPTVSKQGVDSISRSREEDWFWFSVAAPVHTFLEKSFLASYVHGPGELVVLSHANSIDSTDVVAISPNGKLHLAVTKDTYERLGLVGKSSEFAPRQRFNIAVDLRHRSFLPGRKLHDRVYECLGERTQALEYLCAYSLDGQPQELAFPGGITATRHVAKRSTRRLHSLPLPPIAAPPRPEVIAPADGSGDRDAEEIVPSGEGAVPLDAELLEALYEWLGAVACGAVGIDAEARSKANRVRTPVGYEWPIPWRGETVAGTAEVERWSGLIVPSQVLSCLQSARERVKNGDVPWAAINVWGFADAPVSWDGAEHGYLMGGENDYSIILLPDDCYLLFRACGSHDGMR